MPFITIPSFNLKILIDSGASNSIMNPNSAFKYFKDKFFCEKFSVKSLTQTIRDDKNINYPILKDFGIENSIKFHVLKWHDRFDALLGSHDLQRLGAKIDYSRIFWK